MNARTLITLDDPSLMSDSPGTLRTPPASIESESSVLGGLLLNNAAWDRVADLLIDTDFYRYEHRLIFAAVGSLINANKPADVITVYQHLQAQGKDGDVGGIEYLNALAQYVPSAANIRRYAEIVRERAILRKLVAASDEIASAAFNTQGRSVAVIADEAEQRIFSIIESGATSGDEWESMDKMIVTELDMIQQRADGNDTERSDNFISTGLADWDDMLDGGLRGGQLVVVGGRPGMGKTALADSVGLHVSLNEGLPVGKFSMEMVNQEGGQRALSSVSRVPLHMLRRPERMSDLHWGSLTQGVEMLRNIPFYSNDKGGLNINQIRTKARVLRRRHGLRLLIVDYLQLMSGTDTRTPRTYQLEEASRGLKSLAKELNIPVIALVQVNRGVEKEVDQMPRMSDIKDCGSIEQDADIILFLHRPIVAKPELTPEWKPYARAQMVKQRGGRTGNMNFMYVGENTRFTNWPATVEVPTSKVITKGGNL